MAGPGTLHRNHGVVLRTHKLGEADRIVVLLTRERGKVRAVAKGVRKTKSRIGSKLEPANHVQVQCYEGRGELDTVTSVDGIEHFGALRTDLDLLTRAINMLEAVDHLALQDEPAPRLYTMLVGALRALAESRSPLVVPAFYWKLLALEGFGPTVHACARCGTGEGLVAFELFEGGVLCRACRRGAPVSPDALALLQRILGGQLAAALNEAVTPATDELDQLATRAFEQVVERRLRSHAVFDATRAH